MKINQIYLLQFTGTSTSLGGSITLAAITNGSGIQSGSITNDLIGSIVDSKLNTISTQIKYLYQILILMDEYSRW